MRTGTVLFLLAVILLFAFFGLKFLKGVLIAFLLLPILLFIALGVGIWLLKRRMNRKLRELQQVLTQAQSQAIERQRQARSRRDAIDVDPADVRERH